MKRWDLLIITASDEIQSRYFDLQLCSMLKDIWIYIKDYHIQVDKSQGIGTGLSACDAIESILLKKNINIDESRILLIHSGGFSKRLPHVAPFGKIFSYLPDGRTILEQKLYTYQYLPFLLSSGVFICSCDTIETLNLIPEDELIDISKDLIFFGHYSTEEIAKQHGVFIINKNDKKVEKILQKPSSNELINENAMIKDGLYITDSCFFLSNNICKNLVKIINETRKDLLDIEFCCYGDFMRPIGKYSTTEYINNTGDDELKKWRQVLYDYFNNFTGKESTIVHEYSKFYHFGTYDEYIYNSFNVNEIWCEKQHIYSIIDNKSNISEDTFIEFSQLGNNIKVEENSFLSNVTYKLNKEVIIPKNTVVITWYLQDNKYVTIMFPIKSDIKTKFEELKWYNIIDHNVSLYNSKLFPLGNTSEESLIMTMNYAKNCIKAKEDNYISIEDAINQVDVIKHIKQRRELMNNHDSI